MLLLCSLALLASASSAVEILDLKQESSSLNTITLTWSLSPADTQVEAYTLLVDGLINQFKDPDNTLTHIQTDLVSCTEYDFQLTATVAGVDSAPATTTGATAYETPGDISDLHISDDGTAMEWTAPSNEKCVDHYEVCWTSTNLETDYCNTTATTNFSLGAMSGCDYVKSTVAAVSGGLSATTGPEQELHFDTPYGDPGAPQNFEVISLPGLTVELRWDLPEENPACIVDQIIEFGPYVEENVTVGAAARWAGRQVRKDDEALVTNLTACTNYLFDLSFKSTQGVRSESAYDNATTEYLSPEEISGVDFDATTETITVTWGEAGQTPCLAYIEICYQDATTHEVECVNAEDPVLDREVIISGLEACRHYEFAVAGVSITGEFGPPTTHEVVMDDMAPGPVQNLEAESVSTSSLLVTYDPPLVRPECVVEYVLSHTQILPDSDTPAPSSAPATRGSPAPRAGPGGVSGAGPVRGTVAARAAVGDAVKQSLARAKSRTIEDNISGLEACSDYYVTVHAASGSNQAGNETTVRTRTMDENPGAPTDLRTVLTTTTSITFTFFAPDNRFCASSYKVGYSIRNSEEAEKHITLDNADFALERMVTLEDLKNCATYMITVSSEGDLGSSSAAVLTQDTVGCL